MAAMETWNNCNSCKSLSCGHSRISKLRASIGDSGGWISSVVLHKNNTLTVCCSVSFFTTKIFQIPVPAFWCPKMLFMCQKKAKTVKQTLFSKISRYTLTGPKIILPMLRLSLLMAWSTKVDLVYTWSWPEKKKALYFMFSFHILRQQ